MSFFLGTLDLVTLKDPDDIFTRGMPQLNSATCRGTPAAHWTLTFLWPEVRVSAELLRPPKTRTSYILVQIPPSDDRGGRFNGAAGHGPEANAEASCDSKYVWTARRRCLAAFVCSHFVNDDHVFFLMQVEDVYIAMPDALCHAVSTWGLLPLSLLLQLEGLTWLQLWATSLGWNGGWPWSRPCSSTQTGACLS